MSQRNVRQGNEEYRGDRFNKRPEPAACRVAFELAETAPQATGTWQAQDKTPITK